MARRQAEPLVEVVLARRARLAADALGQARGAEREAPGLDRLLERPVAARQLRGDRAAVLRVARDRRAVQQDRGSLVAAVARAGPHRGVQDDEVVAHYARAGEGSPSVNRIDRLVGGLDGNADTTLHPRNALAPRGPVGGR